MRVYDSPRTTAANLRKSRFSREDKKPVLYGVGCLIPIALMLVAAPKWTILAGDSGTTAKMVDHYKEGKVSSFIPGYDHDDDYANFYDWSDAVPTLHYAIDGSDMVVSYVFKDCFFSGWPMQDACDVWAGVDFYRIDDELGPIKVSGFTTRDLEPLAPRKTPESDAVP